MWALIPKIGEGFAFMTFYDQLAKNTFAMVCGEKHFNFRDYLVVTRMHPLYCPRKLQLMYATHRFQPF